MRKSFVILIAIASFGLGLASQNLFANAADPYYEYPAENETPPTVTKTYFRKNGWTIYRFPDNWKMVGHSSTNLGNVAVQFKRKIGTR